MSAVKQALRKRSDEVEFLRELESRYPDAAYSGQYDCWQSGSLKVEDCDTIGYVAGLAVPGRKIGTRGVYVGFDKAKTVEVLLARISLHQELTMRVLWVLDDR